MDSRRQTGSTVTFTSGTCGMCVTCLNYYNCPLSSLLTLLRALSVRGLKNLGTIGIFCRAASCPNLACEPLSVLVRLRYLTPVRQGYPDIRTVNYWIGDDKAERFPQSKTMNNHNKADGFERRLEVRPDGPGTDTLTRDAIDPTFFCLHSFT